MADEKKLIDLNGLADFKGAYDLEIDEKISKSGGKTYTLTKDADGNITLTGSDGSVTSVTSETFASDEPTQAVGGYWLTTY